MANILYLVHRLPYPPNKGDKVRSYHLLKHLAAKHRVFLGTFVDDPEDEAHVEAVQSICAELHVSALNPRTAKLRSLAALLDGRPLSLAYYADRAMREWVAKITAEQSIDATVVFSSAMGQYANSPTSTKSCPILVDFVDVDSTKWTQYASQHRWPMSWIYAREGRRLLAYERELASSARMSFFVTENEATLFRRLAPESAKRVQEISNGVDAEFFASHLARQSPFGPGEVPIVFTGAMDYWPNIDAVTWFIADMLPQLRRTDDRVRFYVVGRSPVPAIKSLASQSVVVTGTVPDVRPYLQHAAVVVAPMRVARGVQNKVLEAMSMGRPVVAARDCVDAISAVDGQELVAATTAPEYVDAVKRLIDSADLATGIGAAGRRCVVNRFSWDAHLSKLDAYLSVAKRDQTLAVQECHEPA